MVRNNAEIKTCFSNEKGVLWTCKRDPREGLWKSLRLLGSTLENE